MRALFIACFLSATGLFAQLGAPNYAPAAPQSTITFGVQSFGPSLDGHMSGTLDGHSTVVDLNGDLGIGKDGAKTGLFFDYQGHSFGFQASTSATEYAGNKAVTRDVTVNGATYPNGTMVQSRVKLTSLDGIWTIKLVSEPDSWLGVDLGLQAWTLDLQTAGTSGGASSVSIKAPIPQVGLSGGSRAYNGAFESKAYIRYMNAKGGKYTMLGTDFRVFLTRWLGLRAFFETSHLKASKGAVKDDLEIGMDRKGVGFGAVLRF
ncbi:MAG TPA: hypothetical protein VJ486_01750 [Geothrix sp.]|nr:hypothetical protein [Geothrix sp.]